MDHIDQRCTRPRISCSVAQEPRVAFMVELRCAVAPGRTMRPRAGPCDLELHNTLSLSNQNHNRRCDMWALGPALMAHDENTAARAAPSKRAGKGKGLASSGAPRAQIQHSTRTPGLSLARTPARLSLIHI